MQESLGTVNCVSLLVVNEVYIVNIPSLLFIILGPINFYFIRSIGFNRVVKYSTLFKVKRYVVWMIIIISISKVGFSIIQKDWWANKIFNTEHCKKEYIMFNFMRSFSIIAWIGSLNLMVYQYRKGLSESWYSLKMFWWLNFLAHV